MPFKAKSGNMVCTLPRNNSAGILEQSMGARIREGIGLSYHPPGYMAVGTIPWIQFLGFLKV
jgi:hypothetical protein